MAAALHCIAFAADIGISILSGEDAIERLGNPTIWSVGLWLTLMVFAIASIAALVSVWRARGARRFVYAYSAAVSLALVIAAAYMAYWGMIGRPTWM